MAALQSVWREKVRRRNAEQLRDAVGEGFCFVFDTGVYLLLGCDGLVEAGPLRRAFLPVTVASDPQSRQADAGGQESNLPLHGTCPLIMQLPA